jgi:2-methylcitrate dehydratase PrpD
MAAAAGVAAARGLDRTAIRDSLGVAGSMASGIIEYLADGSSTKRLHAGWAAQSGLRAAALGGAGFTGPATVFEGTHGLFFGFANDTQTDFTPLVAGLGERWEAARLAFKPFACGTMTQPYVDCAIDLARRGVDPASIERIVCEVGEGTVHRLWEPLASKQTPPTPYAAKFSGPWCVAAGFVFGDAGLAQFTEAALSNEAARGLARRVSFIVDPDNPYPANYTGHVRATLKSGEVVEARAPCLRGGAQAPLSRSALLAKCAANLRFARRDPDAAQRIADWADGLMTGTGAFDAAPLRLAEG